MLYIAFVCKRVLYVARHMNPDLVTIKNLSHIERLFSNNSISETMFSQQNVSVTASSICPSVSLLCLQQLLAPPRKLLVQAEEQETQKAKNYLNPGLTRPIS